MWGCVSLVCSAKDSSSRLLFQRPQIIDISQFAPHIFKYFPVPVARVGPICLLQVLFNVGLHAIVVDEVLSTSKRKMISAVIVCSYVAIV
jgi:hypothetical protein